MMLGLDPLQSHACFASWLLLSLWLTKEAARHEEEEGICFFLTACYDLPVCFLFLCMVSWQHFFTQAAAAPFHSNSCIQCVVFPALGEPASDCSIPTHPPPRHQHWWGCSLSSKICFSSWGPSSKLPYFNEFNFFPLCLHALGWRLLSAATTIVTP